MLPSLSRGLRCPCHHHHHPFTPHALFVCILPSSNTVCVNAYKPTTIACCPRCHTGLWNHYADAGPCLAYLRVGTLDRPDHIDPDVHIFTRTRRRFVALADGKPQFEGYYPDRNPFYRPDVLARVAALEGRQAAYKAQLMAALST
ncbi:hypothetical protein JDV02_001568 [Purpureocillium takamizusanense]|uniref:CENP-V/GFA domain-containing protein n=1 Tax=Purpureocillium takamizusanense TaxID=2060973 RepID=A0A9Q8Q7D8_9HYPO|nr:uncharacterized protein JDV02_001568 [Purpureocillium takamizusanense]UNI14993.1 hypothetical protein JDV02_001568 [Purpureocillium takamizusanense]